MKRDDLDFDEFDDTLEPPRRRRRGSRRMGVLTALMVVAVAAVTTVIVGLQTEGGCALLADYFKQQTGLEVRIGAAHPAFPLDLVMRDVELKPDAARAGVFKAREIRVGWRWGESLPVRIDGLHLEFRKTADGWSPSAFERLATLDDVRRTEALLREEPRGLRMDVTDSTLLWRAADGEVIASAQGLNVAVTPISARGRFLRLIEVTAAKVKRESGVSGLTVRRAWLAGTETPYLELEYRGVWEGDGGRARDWWSTPGTPIK
jgi:hypothetical protein